MHCTNCGWNNPEGSTVCEKCQQPLAYATPTSTIPTVSRPTVPIVQQSYPAGYAERPTVPQGASYHAPSYPAPSYPATDGEKTHLENSPSEDSGKGTNTVGLWIAVGVLSVLTLIFIFLYTNEKRSVAYWQQRHASSVRDNKELQAHIEKVADVCPIVITEIQMGNTKSGGQIISDYGKKIYSSKTQFLKARISYMTVDANVNDDIELKYNLYTPSTGTSSPSGYSSSGEVEISSYDTSAEIFGWGYSQSGHWAAGTYKFEIYYADRCIGVKTFTIY